MSQVSTIREMLEEKEWVCSSEFMERMYIVDYRRRICDLKDQGSKIESRPCLNRCGRNHKANLYQYRFVNDKPVFGQTEPERKQRLSQVRWK